MNLYEEYDKAAKSHLEVPYWKIISNPAFYFEQLLNRYGLSKITNINDLCSKLSANRILHVINLYLSKDFLFEKLFNLHFSDYQEKQNSYEWDLLALAHDLGYGYESELFSSDVFSITDLCKKLNLYSFFESSNNPSFYKNATYTNYFKYKREQFDVCDHGIVGGILLFNLFHSKELTSDSLINLAYVIASHNIFTANLPSAQMYYQYELAELIPSDSEYRRLPMDHNKYAYYYLYLCMIDILEPINAFNFDDLEQQIELLKNLSYRIGEKGLEITTCNPCYAERIIKRIYDIAIWMNIRMIVHSPNSIELQVT